MSFRKVPRYLPFAGKIATRAPDPFNRWPGARAAQAKPLPTYQDRRAAQGFWAAQGFRAAHGFVAAQGLVGAQGLFAAQGFVALQGSPEFVVVDGAAGWQGLWKAAAGFAVTAVPPKTAMVPSAIMAFRIDKYLSVSMDVTSFLWGKR